MIMVLCAVKGCCNNNNKKSTTYNNNCRYFTFPKNESVSNIWVRETGQTVQFNIKTARICSDHFLDNDYRLKEQLLKLERKRWKLKPEAVPSINLPEILRLSTCIREKRLISAKKDNDKIKNKTPEKLLQMKTKQAARIPQFEKVLLKEEDFEEFYNLEQNVNPIKTEENEDEERLKYNLEQNVSWIKTEENENIERVENNLEEYFYLIKKEEIGNMEK